IAFLLFLVIRISRNGWYQFRDIVASLLLLGFSSCGIIILYTFLGGDHFEFFRFLQPAELVLPISTVITLVFLLKHLRSAEYLQGWIFMTVAVLMACFIVRSGL